MKNGVLLMGAIFLVGCVVLATQPAVGQDSSPWKVNTAVTLNSARAGTAAAETPTGPQKYLHVNVNFNVPANQRKQHNFRVTNVRGETVGELFGFKDNLLIFEGNWQPGLAGLYLDANGHRQPLFDTRVVESKVVHTPIRPVAPAPAVVRRPTYVPPVVRAPERRVYGGTRVIDNRDDVVIRDRGVRVIDDRDDVVIRDRGVRVIDDRDDVVIRDRGVRVIDDHDTVVVRDGGRDTVVVRDGGRDKVVIHEGGGTDVVVDGGTDVVVDDGGVAVGGGGPGAGGPGAGAAAAPGEGCPCEGSPAEAPAASPGEGEGEGEAPAAEPGKVAPEDCKMCKGTKVCPHCKGEGCGKCNNTGKCPCCCDIGSPPGEALALGPGAGPGPPPGEAPPGEAPAPGQAPAGSPGEAMAKAPGAGPAPGQAPAAGSPGEPCPCGKDSPGEAMAKAPGMAPGPGTGPGGPGPGGPGTGPGGPGPGGPGPGGPGTGPGPGGPGPGGPGREGYNGPKIEGIKPPKAAAFVLYVSTGDADAGTPGKVYQVNEHSRVLGWVNLPSTPTGMALHRDNGLVLALPREGGKIMRIDDRGKTAVLMEKNKDLVHPTDVAIGGGSDSVIVADNIADVLMATTTGGTKPKVYERFEGQKWTAQDMSVAITNDKHVILGTNGDQGIFRFSGDDQSARSKPLLPGPGGVAADPKSLKWAATQKPNQIYVFEGDTLERKLRLPPGKSLYRNGLLSFSPCGSLCVAGRDNDKAVGEPWLFMYNDESDDIRSLFPWKKETMTDFVVGPRMFWDGNSPNNYKSTY